MSETSYWCPKHGQLDHGGYPTNVVSLGKRWFCAYCFGDALATMIAEAEQRKTIHPCPWCGNPANVTKSSTNRFHVMCETKFCGAGPECSTESDAIDAWNQRR